MVDRKSSAYVPAWDELAVLPLEAEQIAAQVPLQRGGIELLGGVAEGAYAASLGRRRDDPPVAKRAARACRVSRGLAAMANAGLDVGGRQPAWQIGRLCVATSLHYDARVNATADLEPYALMVRAGLVGGLGGSCWRGP